MVHSMHEIWEFDSSAFFSTNLGIAANWYWLKVLCTTHEYTQPLTHTAASAEWNAGTSTAETNEVKKGRIAGIAECAAKENKNQIERREEKEREEINCFISYNNNK